VPDGVPSDIRCTEYQLSAITEFYCDNFQNDLTYSQAHWLLSYREYAKACASNIFYGAHPKVVLLYSRVIAAFISARPDISAYAVARSNKRFRAGIENSRVSRTKYFEEISNFIKILGAEAPLN